MNIGYRKAALVTGATSGIGRCVAHRLAHSGWTVLVHGRTAEKAADAASQLASAPGQAVPVYGDLESSDGVRELVEQSRALIPDRLDALVNNAGAAFAARGLTADGIERTIAVNHLAVARVTKGLGDVLGGGRSRIVMVTSSLEAYAPHVDDWSYARGWTQMRAYMFSKVVNLAYTYALADRLGDSATVYAVDPGAVRSGFQRSAGGTLRLVGALGGAFMAPPDKSARYVADAVVGSAEHPTGSYLRRGRPRTSSARSRDRDFQHEVMELTNRYLAS